MTVARAIANLMYIHRELVHTVETLEEWDKTFTMAILALKEYQDNLEEKDE